MSQSKLPCKVNKHSKISRFNSEVLKIIIILEKFPELISSKKLTFYSIDKKQLSKTITMEDIMNENFYVGRFYSINF
jgi:hypothetical protein